MYTWYTSENVFQKLLSTLRVCPELPQTGTTRHQLLLSTGTQNQVDECLHLLGMSAEAHSDLL